MEEEKIKISDIQPDPENPRYISSEAENKLLESVKSFGNIAGITFNKRTKQLVAGHQRFNQLKKEHEDLSLREVNKDLLMITAQGKDTGFLVRVVDWDENKQKAANIVANAPHIGGEFDFSKLDHIKEKYDFSEFEAFNLSAIEEFVMPHGEGKGGSADKEKESAFEHKIVIHTDYETLSDIKEKLIELVSKYKDKVKIVI